MENGIIFSLPDHAFFAKPLASRLNLELGSATTHTFPDGETCVRIASDVKNRDVILLCPLDHPNDKILPLMFMAQTIREFAARKICLVAPYLPYMRQDKRFHPGEAISARLFANLLSQWVDGLVTVDPHLHRIKNLADIYTIPHIAVLHAAQPVGQWICQNIDSPLIIGPDEESRQWVADIANHAKADYIICQKTRRGDNEVDIIIPAIKDMRKTPVLVDDIISTGASMMTTLRQLLAQGLKDPVCIGIHAMFDLEVEKKILMTGAKRIITCNTIAHSSSQIDLTDLIAKGVQDVY